MKSVRDASETTLSFTIFCDISFDATGGAFEGVFEGLGLSLLLLVLDWRGFDERS